ncbi:MAG: hypothetical protein J5849_06505 [Clostridia bacterium]|nr:hypothetical protein [Clostridia bacterium]MBR5743219.1 hypothetical protein [Clostridia bacterium]
MEALKSERMDQLMKAVVSISSVEEAYAFMEDLCSVAELKAMEQRFTVARLLKSKMPYNLIINATGASTTTISRVNRSLLYGNGSYDRIFERLEEKE